MFACKQFKIEDDVVIPLATVSEIEEHYEPFQN